MLQGLEVQVNLSGLANESGEAQVGESARVRLLDLM